MRRIVTAILLVMLVSLTGCTAKEEETVCAFTYNGIRMVPGEEAESVLTALGAGLAAHALAGRRRRA